MTHPFSKSGIRSKVHLILVTAAIAASLSPGLIWSAGLANAETAPAAPAAQSTPVQPQETPREVDSTLSRDFKPATIYIHDPATHQLVPRVAMVAADQPVVGAVTQIMDSYEGQDVGIRGYDVKVNTSAKRAQINFKVESPRQERALQSLSSSNQYAMFEAIRETLDQPEYQIRQVVFSANGKAIDL